MEILECSKPGIGLVEQLREILRLSFPPFERIPIEELIAAVEGQKARLFVSMEGSLCVGFGVAVEFPRSCCVFLEYLAVAPEMRSQGIGSGLLRHMIDKFAHENNHEAIVFEVESDEACTGPEMRARRRRMSFYRTQGAHALQCVREIPVPKLDSLNGTYMVKLMFIPLGRAADGMTAKRLRVFIQELYEVIYMVSVPAGILNRVPGVLKHRSIEEGE